MKKLSFRIIALVAVFSLLIPFAGCKDDESANKPEDRVVLSFRGETVTESEFAYYLAIYKARFSRTYTDFRDTAEFYESEIGGVKMEEYLFDMVVQNVKRSLVSEVLYSEFGMEITDVVNADIDYYIDTLYFEHFGYDEAAFNEALAGMGITSEQLKELYIRDEKTYSLFEYLEDEKTTLGMNDTAMQEYLLDNYVRIRHIYVNNKYVYMTDSNGNPVFGTDGKQKTTPMTGETLSAKNALIDAIDLSLAEGGDFDEIYDAFSEDKYYANGYYLTKDMEFVDEVVSAAFELEIGEWVKIESDVGTHYIKRLEMDDTPWDDSANADFFDGFTDTVMNELFAEYLDSFADEVTVDEEVLSEFDLPAVKANYIF